MLLAASPVLADEAAPASEHAEPVAVSAASTNPSPVDPSYKKSDGSASGAPGLSLTAPNKAVEPDRDADAVIEELTARVEKLERAEEERRSRAFVKGWLTGVGDVDFYSSKHRVVVGLQLFPIEQRVSDTITNRTYYLAAVPRASLHFGRLYMGFELPVAFEVFNTEVDSSDADYLGGRGFDGAGAFAGFQWDEPSEFAQVIKYIRYGTKEDDFYLNVSKQSAATVGHGTVLRRYNPNIDLDHYRVSAQVDKGFKYGGAEFYTNDVLGYGVNGGLVYVKPGGMFFPDNLLARSASVGLSYVFDRKAPYLLAHPEGAPDQLVSDDTNAPVVNQSAVAAVVGLDAEVKLVRQEKLDVKAYLDYSRLTHTQGDGVSAGALVRFNVGGNKEDSRVHAFRLRAEAGAYHAQYAPGYFDMFYEIQKYQNFTGADADVVQSKLMYLEQQTGGYRLGGRFEGTYSVVGGMGVSAAYQGSMDGRDDQMLMHVEVPTGEHLRLLATYVRNNPRDGQPLFTLENPNVLLIGKAKIRVLPFMFINGEVSQMYRLRATDGSSESTLTAGRPAQFENVLRWVLETEVGFEF